MFGLLGTEIGKDMETSRTHERTSVIRQLINADVYWAIKSRAMNIYHMHAESLEHSYLSMQMVSMVLTTLLHRIFSLYDTIINERESGERGEQTGSHARPKINT